MSSSFVVVGAGVFGASTALELAKAGHDVTVLERSSDGYHAPDAASNDINKIIRPDYSDNFYRNLARRAISAWRRSPVLAPYYHEVGVLFHTGTAQDGPGAKAYIDEAVEQARQPSIYDVPRPGQDLPSLAYHVDADADALRQCFPPLLRSRVGRLAQMVQSRRTHAYFSSRAGWGEADRATRAVLDEAKCLGVKVVPNACVTEVICGSSPQGAKKSRVIGVRTSDGRQFMTDGSKGHVVLATGAWGNGLLSRLLNGKIDTPVMKSIPFWPSAQCVIALLLNEEQRRACKNAPVVLDFASGFYFFEPDADGVMKIAIHSGGYQYPLPSMAPSAPASFPTFQDSTQRPSKEHESQLSSQAAQQKEATIPADKVEQMLAMLAVTFPDLANAPIVYTRVCFYSESHDENWIIDHVPDVEGLVMASGDSGHAFKFLPTLGSFVCGRMGIETVPPLTPTEARVWSFAHHAKLHTAAQSTSRRDSTLFKGRL